MKISQISAQGLKQNYSVIVPAADMDQKIQGHLMALGKKVKIPGFRPGKVPETILKQRYGTEATKDALEKVVQSAIQKISEENKIRRVGQPTIKIDSFDAGKDLEFTVKFELLPTVELKDFGTIELENLVVDVSDKEIMQEIDKLVSTTWRYQPLPTERPAQEGDRVQLNLVATIDKKPVKGFDKPIQVIVGQEAKLFSGALEAAVKGVKAGDQVDVTEKVPENWGDKALAAQDLHLAATVESVEEPLKQEFNLEFAKQLGFENQEQLKERIHELLNSKYNDLARLRLKRYLLDALSEAYDFDLPESMVQNEFNTIWMQLQKELEQARQNGTLEEDDDRPEEELKKEYRSISERRVRLGLVISEVAQQKKIKIEDSDLRQAILREAMQYPGQQEEVIAFFNNNPNTLESLAASILENKAVDAILTEVKLIEKTVSSAELYKAIRGVVPGFEDDEEDEKEGTKGSNRKDASKEEKALKGKSTPSQKDKGK
jgi:trigger factor